jgi:hypothetical protein
MTVTDCGTSSRTCARFCAVTMIASLSSSLTLWFCGGEGGCCACAETGVAIENASSAAVENKAVRRE